MFINNIISAGALISLVAAVPLQHVHKRDIVWETKVEWAYTTIPITSTIWLEPGETPPAHAHHRNHHKKITSHIRQTVTVSPSPVNSPAAETSAYSSPTQSEASPAPVAPTTTAYTPPAASPTTAAPAPAPTTTQSSGGGGSGGSGGSPSGQTYTGDITYYTPGLGSCGTTSTESDSIVALPHGMMEAQGVANPNSNPLCGKTITISYGGVTASATVVDTCEGCSGDSIDLSPSLFEKFTPLATGRVSGVQWWFS